jgi:hypothetical protein
VRLLLDENVSRPLHQAIAAFVLGHEIVHLLDLDRWSGTRDENLYPRAAAEGFHVILTNDARQMQRPREVEAIRLRVASDRIPTQAPWPHRNRPRDRHGRRRTACCPRSSHRGGRTTSGDPTRRRPDSSQPPAHRRPGHGPAEILAVSDVIPLRWSPQTDGWKSRAHRLLRLPAPLGGEGFHLPEDEVHGRTLLRRVAELHEQASDAGTQLGAYRLAGEPVDAQVLAEVRE